MSELQPRQSEHEPASVREPGSTSAPASTSSQSGGRGESATPGLAGLLSGLPRPLRIGAPLLVIGAIIGAVLLMQRGRGGSAGSSEIAASGALESRPPAKGEPAPDFALPALDGALVRLKDLRGKPVLINFWATWCGPCRSEMPDIQRAYAESNGDLVVLAVNVEGAGAAEARRLATDYRDEMNFTFPVLLDTPEAAVFEQYRLRGLPDSVFVDRDGTVRDMVIGPLSQKALTQKLAALTGK